MKEYFAHVIARMIVGYLTFVFLFVVILAGHWIIEDYSAMVEFMQSISENTFAHIVIWLPFVFSWFKPSKSGSANAYYHKQVRFWEMYDTTGGRW